jgi:hypothetical protein
LRNISVGLIVLALAQCSASPLPFAETESAQGFLRGADYWKLLAETTVKDVVNCVVGRVILNEDTERHEPICIQDITGLVGRPIYVELVDTDTSFGQAFHEFLTTALINQGQSVSHAPEDALIVRTRLRFVPRSFAAPVRASLIVPASSPSRWVVLYPR